MKWFTFLNWNWPLLFKAAIGMLS